MHSSSNQAMMVKAPSATLDSGNESDALKSGESFHTRPINNNSKQLKSVDLKKPLINPWLNGKQDPHHQQTGSNRSLTNASKSRGHAQAVGRSAGSNNLQNLQQHKRGHSLTSDLTPLQSSTQQPVTNITNIIYNFNMTPTQ